MAACRALRPDAPLLLDFLADLRATAGDLAAAEAACRAEIARAPTGYNYHTLGNVFIRRKDWASAADAFRRAADLAPELPEAWYRLELAWVQLRDAAKAEEAFRRLVELDRDHAGGHFYRGVSLAGLKRWDDAAAVRRAMDLDPKRFRQDGAGMLAAIRRDRRPAAESPHRPARNDPAAVSR